MPSAAENDQPRASVSPLRRAQDRSLDVSIVVPFWDEEGNIERLSLELDAAMASQGRSYEVILVDDGSQDRSPAEAKAATEKYEHFRVIRLRRHLGKSAALAAGRDLSRGQILVTIDADLQDPPDAIPRFLDAIDAGADLVAARRDRRQEPWHRRAVTAVFNWMNSTITGIPIHDMNAGLKAYTRPAIDSVHLSRGMHRFLAVFAHAKGFKVTELSVSHGKRFKGRSKYGLWRYVEATAGIALVMFLSRGPGRAMKTLVRIAGAALVLGAVAAGLGWWLGSPLTLFIGAILFLLGTQLFVARLVSEVLFQFVFDGGKAPPPYELLCDEEEVEAET